MTDVKKDDKEYLGHAVRDGNLLFLSVSALEKANPREKGCWLRWFFRYVLGFKETDLHPEAKAKGEALHLDAKNYLLTGTLAVDPLLLKGMHFIPERGPDLEVERKFYTVVQPATKTTYPIIDSPLEAAGIPIIGAIDCAHARGTNKGGQEFDFQDPAGTIEVIDWKRKGNAKTKDGTPTWKSGNELIHTTQMAGYGELQRRRFPWATHIRLSHGYFFEKGSAPRKSTKLHVIDDFPKAWEYVNGLARTLRDIARETDPARVDGNLRACDEYGGCPNRERCPAWKKGQDARVYGDAAQVAKEFKEQNQMTLLNGLPNFAPQGAPQTPTAPQAVQMPPGANFGPPGFVGGPAPNMEGGDMRAQLEAEEQRTRAQSFVNNTVNYRTVWESIQRHGRGCPTIGGEAAVMIAQAYGQQLGPNGAFAGQGELSPITITIAAELAKLAAELDNRYGTPGQQSPQTAPQTQAPPVTQQAPQTVPAPNGLDPNIAAAFQKIDSLGIGFPQYHGRAAMLRAQYIGQPFNGAAYAGGGQYAQTVVEDPAHIIAFAASLSQTISNAPVMAPNAPSSHPALASAGEQQATEKKPVGRPPKKPKNTDTAPEPTSGGQPQTVSAPVPPSTQGVSTSPAPGAVSTSPSTTGYQVYVNCRPEGVQTRNLRDYIETVNAQLAAKYCRNADGSPMIQDIRIAPKGGPLEYNGWKGAVRDIFLSGPPPADMPLHLDTFDELTEIVAEAMRVVCVRTGGLYVRGTR